MFLLGAQRKRCPPHWRHCVDEIEEFAGMGFGGEEKVQAVWLLVHAGGLLVRLVLQNNLLQEIEGLLVVHLKREIDKGVSWNCTRE